MTVVDLVIRGDLATGGVSVHGPIDDMRMVNWLLGEARRICERRADQRDAETSNGKPQILVARGLVPPQ